jgi:Fe-S-cluster containining protein
VNADELKSIAEYLGKTVNEVRLEHTRLVGRRISLTERSNGDCTFFDSQTRHCKIYPVRPKQCRTWPFWNSNLESPETWDDTQRHCPGAGHGAFFSLDEIKARAAEIDI